MKHTKREWMPLYSFLDRKRVTDHLADMAARGGVLDRLERDWGVTVLQDGEDAVFRLAPSVRFEDLDYVWGALFEVLG